MLTAGLPHTAVMLESYTLPRALLDDSRTLLHTLPHTAALLGTAVCFAAHRRTSLHEFECRTAAHRALHTVHSHTPQVTRV
jgi:hypothetical protein